MVEQHPTIFWDRSRANADDTCERARFYLTALKGRGIVPINRPLYFDFGSIIANAHHRVRSGAADAAQVAREVEGQAFEATLRAESSNPDALPQEIQLKARENACLASALIEGFYVEGGMWDLLMEDYEVAHTEVELTLEHEPGVVFGCRPDLVLRRKSDGAYGYPDDKTTVDLSVDWWKQWDTDVQLQSGARAIKESLGYDISFVMVLAHYKGYRSKKYGLTSPLVYGYKSQPEPGMGQPRYVGNRPSSWKGWDKFAVYAEMGPAEWVRQMPREDLMANFAMTRPIAIREDLTAAWLAQRAMREREIDKAMKDIQEASPEDAEWLLNKHFRQNFKACSPRRLAPCAYRDVCFLDHVKEDPIASKLYDWRQPHHDTDPLYQVAVPE